MRRIKVNREAKTDPRDEEIKRLQERIEVLESLLLDARVFGLHLQLKCTTGNAAFTGEMGIRSLDGTVLTTSHLEGYFKSTRRKEAQRDFTIPMSFACNTKDSDTIISLGNAHSPDWQKAVTQETERKKHPEHILAMRRRIR